MFLTVPFALRLKPNRSISRLAMGEPQQIGGNQRKENRPRQPGYSQQYAIDVTLSSLEKPTRWPADTRAPESHTTYIYNLASTKPLKIRWMRPNPFARFPVLCAGYHQYPNEQLVAASPARTYRLSLPNWALLCATQETTPPQGTE